MKTIPIGQQFSLKKNNEALRLYYDEYKDKLKKFLDWDYEEFAENNAGFDIYGLYNDNILCGCIYFERINDSFVFHVAVLDEVRGKWSFCWESIKKWMLENYNPIFSVTHREDAYTNRLIARSGFTYVEDTQDFYWWRLWAEQPEQSDKSLEQL